MAKPILDAVTIILPAYNEELLIKNAMAKIINWARSQKRHVKILIIENGSSDQTAQIAKDLARRHRLVELISLGKPSFGAAVKTGLQAVDTPLAILLNVDWIDTEFMDKALGLLDRADIVVGSKVLDPAADERPRARKMLSKLLTKVVRQMYGFKGSDTHGLKGIKMAALGKIISRCQPNEIIETELLLRAQRQQLMIIEIPVKIKELRPPRLSVLKRCGIVIKQLWSLKHLMVVNLKKPR